MNKTELREMIDNGENSGVELKRDTEDNRALAKELVAFANLQGGRVLLGVEKNRTVFGLKSDSGTGTGGMPRTYDRLEEWIMQACRDKIRPEIIPYFEVIRDVEPGLSTRSFIGTTNPNDGPMKLRGTRSPEPTPGRIILPHVLRSSPSPH